MLETSPARTSSATPRVSPRSLTDEDSETLAVERNGRLTRVGSVASVVATTSSIAIQVVVIPECTHSRQLFAKNIFGAATRKFPHWPVDDVAARRRKGCDDTHRESRPRSRRIRQCSVDEALRRRFQAPRNRCRRGRPAARWRGKSGARWRQKKPQRLEAAAIGSARKIRPTRRKRPYSVR